MTKGKLFLRFSPFTIALSYLVTQVTQVTLLYPKPRLTIFGILNEVLSTQIVNVARSARNID